MTKAKRIEAEVAKQRRAWKVTHNGKRCFLVGPGYRESIHWLFDLDEGTAPTKDEWNRTVLEDTICQEAWESLSGLTLEDLDDDQCDAVGCARSEDALTLDGRVEAMLLAAPGGFHQ